MLLQSLLFSPQVETVRYSEFKALLARSKVGDLVLERQVITGTITTEGLEGVLAPDKIESLKRAGGGVRHFTTARVDDPGLVAALEAARVRFTGRAENPWLGPLLSWVLSTGTR